MTLRISGAGQTCPVPMNLYPSELYNAPLDTPSNFQALAAGDALPIPAQSNDYLVNLGNYATMEWLDAVTGIWRANSDMSRRPGMQHMISNGVDKRVANRTGCPVSAIIANGGTSFTQATATITANVGGSTWQPVVGGTLSLSTIANAGAGYGIAPMIMIPAPTPAGVNGSVGGVPATAYGTIANGTLSAVTFDEIGAGYAFAPTAVVVPSPYDPNFATITPATITLVLTAANSGAITAALCTNFGEPLSTISALTLTAAGGSGSGATITPQVLQTILSASVVAGGAGWGTATASPYVLSEGGGSVSVAAISNPSVDLSGFVPRPAQLLATTNSGGTITTVTVIDGGMFLSTPTAAIASGGTIPTTLASITFTMGSQHGKVLLQNL